MKFSVFPTGPTSTGGDSREERVIFDRCGEFVAVMTHRLTDGNQLRSCWIVNRDDDPVNPQQNMPAMNTHPAHVNNPLAPGDGVPLIWLGLRNNAPYPDPNHW